MPLDELNPGPAQLPEPDVRPSFDVRHPDPVWTGWDVLLIAFMTVVSIVVLSVIGVAVASHAGTFRSLSPTELAREPRLIVPVQVGAYLFVMGLMVLIVRRGSTDPHFWRDIHWNLPHTNFYAFLLGGIVLAIGIQMSSALLPIPKQLPIEKFFKDATSAYIMAAFGTTAAPLFEELFFRGFLYPVLARRAGVTLGTIMTALLFAFIHQSQLGMAWAPLLLLFIVGMVLTVVRVKTNSVASSFLIHVAYNATLFVLLWISTDKFRHMEKAGAAILR
jgi:membrane protease YdiL (CAAX protease family)